MSCEKPARKLHFIFEPKSIAVIGASESKMKVGYAVMNNLLESGYKGKIYPINPKSATILGRKAYKSVLDVPKEEGPIELAVFCIPARFVLATVEQCGKAGVKGAIIITAGFKEVGHEGVELENKLIELVKKYNIRTVGPNCLGIISRVGNASFASMTPKKGEVSMISQSGAMMTSILDWSGNQPIGFSNFISIGNKADLDEVDLIEDSGEDVHTKVIVAYIESIADGKKFLEVIPKVTAKKPVVILKSGTSAAGSAAAASHTGALAQNDVVFESAFKKTGVIRAKEMAHLFDLAALFSTGSKLNGTKFGIVGNAGGINVVAADYFEKMGLELAKINGETTPIDLHGDATPEKYEAKLRTLLKMKDDELAGVLVIVTPQAQTKPEEVANILTKLRKEFPSKAIFSSFMGGKEMQKSKEILMQGKVPNYDFPESAISSMNFLVEYTAQAKELKKRDELYAETVKNQKKVDPSRVKEIFAGAKKEGRTVLNSAETSEIFTLYGVRAPKTQIVKDRKDIDEALKKIAFPCVLKIVSPDIMHKKDCGGVVLNVKSKEEAIKEYDQMLVTVKKNEPKAKIVGIEFQEMVISSNYKKVTELIIGINRDPSFGPMIMVGEGGSYVNYVKDVQFDLIEKYIKSDALKQLKKTNIYKTLTDKKESVSAIDSVVETMMAVARLVKENDEIVELDINPLLVFEEGQGCNAVDIKIKLA